LKMGWKVVGDAVRGGTRHLILLLMLPVLFDVDGYGEDGEVRPVTGSLVSKPEICRNLTTTTSKFETVFMDNSVRQWLRQDFVPGGGHRFGVVKRPKIINVSLTN